MYQRAAVPKEDTSFSSGEMQLNSEVAVRSSSREVIPTSQRAIFHQDEQVTHEEHNFASSYENQNEGTDEDLPRLTTKELRDHFERTIEEAAPSKLMKIGRADINRAQWISNVSQKKVSTSDIKNVSSSEIQTVSSNEISETSTTKPIEDTSAVDVNYEDTECFPPPPPEDLEYFPPPPPDLLNVQSESPDMPVECFYSPEPPESAYPSKRPLSKQEYSKQRSQYELKRLYKHIHPEVRKNLEMYSDADEFENTQQDSQEEITGETRYIYEDNGSSPNDCISPEEEYLEWDEILRGEVQSMRWMFENKPLDAIKDNVSDDNDNKNLEQEIIVGSDVRSKAWMFETKPIDALGSNNIDSSESRKKNYKLDKGDVRAAAWLFENQPMETLNKMHGDEELTKEIMFTQEDGSSTIYMLESQYMETLGHTETIDDSHLLSLRSVLEEIKGELKTITSTFETQFMCVLMGQSGQMLEITSIRKVETEKGDTKTSTWLFDTQALDITNQPSTPVKLICSLSMEDNYKGDVYRGRWLFETKTLDSINEDEWESSTLPKEEIIGADVRKHCLVFETQPMDSLKDYSNVKPETVEEVIGGNVRSARHFFETCPNATLKDLNEVGKLKKLSAAEEEKGDVRHQKWKFENEPLENIRDEKKELIRTVNITNLTEEEGVSYNADVRKNCMVFETQPMDTLKDDSNARALSKEEIVRGNVRSARNYFETVPADNVKEFAEVGKLQKMVRLDEEKGDVRHQKWVFESQPLEHIQEEKKEVFRTVNLEDIDKVDVSNYKQIFESTDLSRCSESQRILVEGVTCGSVQSNKHLFETTPMYAMQDSSGHYHEVKTVRREEVVKGDVTSCKWMFETRPIDQFDESITNYQIIKGISKEEIESGDVKTAKWLFETQPLDAIKYFSNIDDEETTTRESVEIVKGDVKTGKWLFETKLKNVPYEKAVFRSENESEEIQKGDVKTCTWLFETQALDTIRDDAENVLQTCTVNQEDVQGKDVRMARFLFETENLENITGDDESYKRVTEIDIQSGDVNRMKYIFENQSSDIMTSTSDEFMQRLKTTQSEDIQKGNVVNCKWLFENQAIDAMNYTEEETLDTRTVMDVQGGNVDKGRFIFETYSLDKIQQVSSETEADITKLQKITCDEVEKGDVRNYTMMFETQPLYAIQDKEGNYHEVTTVTSEEILKGDVIGSRWLFETKPLDAIRDTEEVYVIKSVTQEDVQKGDVTSAKWRFETHPLDKIADDIKISVKTVEDIQGGDVRMNKQLFESDELSQKTVRTVNVSEIQKGDVRTAKWMFETQTMDKIRSQSEDNLIETVMKEEVVKGDVRQSVWLFEQNPLDHIKEIDDDDIVTVQEEIPKADVKTTTWLFETTPFHDFNENRVEKSEILGKSIKGTLEELYSQKMVNSKGILIEADEIGDVRMAKYQLMNKEAPEIQKEEIIRGDLNNIMMNLLNSRETIQRGVIVESEEKGNISTTVQQLFNQERGVNVEKEEILRGDIQEAVNNLLKDGESAKRGILLQEDEKGDVQMTIYSLLHKKEDIGVEKEDIVKGNIRNALQKLSNPENQEQIKITVEETEKGNVNFYSTCIESGALDYLKQLQVDPDETPPEKLEKEEIIRGDIKGTKLILGSNQVQIDRTVGEEDIVRGDVHNTVKVFMSEPTVSLGGLQKEEIVRGDLKAAINSLSQSVNQTVVVEKEEVVRGNIHKARRHLELAQRQPKEMEKPEIVRGNIKGALRSLEKSETSKVETVIEDLVPGDIKGTLKSLEEAKQKVREIEKEEIVKGNIYSAKQCLQDASNDSRTCQQEIDVHGNVRGTIQLLLEPPASPRMTRRPSFEGDVKMSIKSLYGTHEVNETVEEQTQPEKEDVIKGDVKGTIKSLLESAQRAAPKIRVGARKVKVSVRSPLRSQQGSHEYSVVTKSECETLQNKTQSTEAQRNIQKIKTANLLETESTKQENQSLSTETSITSESQATQQSKTVLQHTTITQSHGIKTLETKFRNLNSSRKGMIRLDKTKVKTTVHSPKRTLSESELSLPPPPPPCDDQSSLTPASSINRLDLDLPPPPTPPPPPVDSEPLHFPSPPPPHDFLPPPPPQHELDSMPFQTPHLSPSKATKMTVKKVKGPALHQVSKLEPSLKIQQETSEKHVTTANTSVMEINTISSESTLSSSKTVLPEIPKPPESPRPLKKVYVAPIRFTPPPSPPPLMKSSKFTTPLIKAEEKYRKQIEDSTPPATPGPVFLHESISAAIEMLSSEEKNGEQSKKSMPFGSTEDTAGRSVKPDALSSGLLNQANFSDTCLISALNEQNYPESADISSIKQHIVSNQKSKVLSAQNQTTVSSTKQQTVTASKQQVISTSTKQSHLTVSSSEVQISTIDDKKIENKKSGERNLKINSQENISNNDAKQMDDTKTNVKKEIKNHQIKSHVQITTSEAKKFEDTEIDIKKDKNNLKTKGSHKSEDKKNKDQSASQGSEKAPDQPIKTDKVTPEKNINAVKLPLEDKINYDISALPEKVSNQPMKVDTVTNKTNIKTSNKKKAKGQETQVEVKDLKQPDETKKENISQGKDLKVEVKEIIKVNVSSGQKHAENSIKVNEDSLKAPATKDNQKATPTSAKKKKKKKSKAKDAAATSESAKSVSECSNQSQEIIVEQPHNAHETEHIPVNKEVISADSRVESKMNQSIHQQGTVKVEKRVITSQNKKELIGNQPIQEKPNEENQNVTVKVESVKMTSKSAQKEHAHPSTKSTEDSQKRKHVEKLISQITELEGSSGKIDSKSVKTLLNTIPEWLIGPEEKTYLEGTAVEHNISKLTEIVSYLKKLAMAKLMCLECTQTTLEKHECEATSEKIIVAGATQRIRKISIGSSKVESQKKVVESKNTSHEGKNQDRGLKLMGSPSPLLRMRSPSPTFITIESTRKTDSPHRITPSPIPMHRPTTPPTPPPRKSETPTSHIRRATPSPTFSRAENLVRLKDTTAKLSRGVTPPPVQLPIQVTEKKSEIVESPASFHRQIKIEGQTKESSGASDTIMVTTKKHKKQKKLKKSEEAQKADVKVTQSFHQTNDKVIKDSEMPNPSIVTSSMKDNSFFFEESQKAEVNKIYMRKDPINIPESLGTDMKEAETTNQEGKESTKSTSEKVTDSNSELKGSAESTHEELIEASVMSDSSTVRNKRESFEDAQKAEMNKTNVRKVPTDILDYLVPAIMESKTDDQEIKEHTGLTTGQVTESNSEAVGFMWNDRWGLAASEALETSELTDSSATTTSVRDKRDFFEEAHKAKTNKTYVRKDPIDIPERLGPDIEDLEPENQENEKEDLPKVDLSGLVNKFETPEEKVYVRKRIRMRERLGSETEYTEGDPETQDEEMSIFDIKAIKNVFEIGEQNPHSKGEKNEQGELESNQNEDKTDTSKQDYAQEPHILPPILPLPSQKAVQNMSADPTGFCETKSVTEHSSSFNEFGNKTVGSTSSTTVSQHSQSITSHSGPFSYADVVKKKGSEVTPSETPDEATTEELLRDFHKTWTESESVFKSLGYSVSEERTSHVVSHQMKNVVTDSSSQVGALHCVSKEGLSDGGSNSGQKKIP
ncbi:xin actin-binding repeat-containing protein 2 isoform X2 [Esox lucius]|uniref:xin actin-binding repeat-containing protein 2 isoform X2 n=1 Tax=Esox lucius TaxID=8010 RepID=UPI001476C1B5|nr:xin actin-binding repeat-containing protein 2 isoform X2 [Esox lucius]